MDHACGNWAVRDPEDSDVLKKLAIEGAVDSRLDSVCVRFAVCVA